MTAPQPLEVLPEMTDFEFENLIDAIRHDSIAQVAATQRGVSTRPYSLVDGLHTNTPKLSDLPSDAKQAIQRSKDEHQASIKKNEEHTAPLAEKRYRGQMSQDEFDGLIDDQVQKNIDEFAARQKELAKKLKEIGRKFPESRALLARAFQAISNFFKNLWDTVAEFFRDLVHKLEKLWNKVKEFFVNTWDTVKAWWQSVLI
ncbi:hypothetical protein [Streptomyces celluloflavus]|uniref:hypothetical protein n=1 Tax=Streptomyces celluloflavus TaxID=58344 RepID=UPI003695B0F6